MRKMISSNIVNKLAVQDGKIGTYVDSYEFTRNADRHGTAVDSQILLVSGITKLGPEWEQFFGPAGATDGTINFSTTYFGEELGFAGYVAAIDGTNYWLGDNLSGTFEGANVVINQANFDGESVDKLKIFKAFILEE